MTISLIQITTSNFEMIVTPFDYETEIEHKELTIIIEKAKSKLSEQQLQALEFAFYSNISIAEAAKLAGCSTKVFRQRVYDAKERLSVLLERVRDY